jgi:3-deoxy-D-manno-octulosonate 8-phosphate phosphatase (KDO 8-P phosphatase)
MTEILHRARAVRLAAFDVDGVLTEGRLQFSAAGEDSKVFDTLDGHGLKELAAAGVELAIISGRGSPALERRAEGLGIARLHQGISDKAAVFEHMLATMGIGAAEAAFMGDDLPDIPVLKRCGLAITVPSAPLAVRLVSHFVTRRAGGRGAVREACDLVLLARSATATPGIAA